MTIAACYLSSEGVVLGADSTTTIFVADPIGQTWVVHHYNFGQKVFEFGDPHSTSAVVIWGLGSLGQKSYRTLIAEAADAAKERNLRTLDEVAKMAATMFWEQYRAAFGPSLDRARELNEKDRSEEETSEWITLKQYLSGGFCVAGRWDGDRTPMAFEVSFGPVLNDMPEPQKIRMGTTKFWGWPSLVHRLILGMDEALFERIIRSEKWTGSREDLFSLIWEGALGQPLDLPLREAIDWIHASIYATIKVMKFSHLAPVCGGPVEIAVISSDRPFRWVRHKQLGEAISVHQPKEDWR